MIVEVMLSSWKLLSNVSRSLNKVQLKMLMEFVLANSNKDTDEEIYRISLSAAAACRGSINLSKAIYEPDTMF